MRTSGSLGRLTSLQGEHYGNAHHPPNLCSDSAPSITGFQTQILPEASEHSRLPHGSPNKKLRLQARAFTRLLALTHATRNLAWGKPRLPRVLTKLAYQPAPGRYTEGEERLERGRPCQFQREGTHPGGWSQRRTNTCLLQARSERAQGRPEVGADAQAPRGSQP